MSVDSGKNCDYVCVYNRVRAHQNYNKVGKCKSSCLLKAMRHLIPMIYGIALYLSFGCF